MLAEALLICSISLAEIQNLRTMELQTQALEQRHKRDTAEFFNDYGSSIVLKHYKLKNDGNFLDAQQLEARRQEMIQTRREAGAARQRLVDALKSIEHRCKVQRTEFELKEDQIEKTIQLKELKTIGAPL